MLLPTNEKQCEFWKLRRGGSSNITAACLPGISWQAVPRALQVIDARIGTADPMNMAEELFVKVKAVV